MNMIEQHRHQAGTLPLCEALEIPRASFYRMFHPLFLANLLLWLKLGWFLTKMCSQ